MLQRVADDELAPPFVASPYLAAGLRATRRRRLRRSAVGCGVVAAMFGVSLLLPALAAPRQRVLAAVTGRAGALHVSIVPGPYLSTGAVGRPAGQDWSMRYSVKWHASARAGICAERATVSDRSGGTLASLDRHSGPFPTHLSFAAAALSGGEPPGRPSPRLTLTVTDCDGHSRTATLNLGMRQNEDAAASYSRGWATGRCACWSGGSAHQSTAAGQAVTYTGSFNAIGILTDQAPGRGTADVYVDGTYVRTIDSAAPTAVNRVLGFQTHFADYGRHTVQIRVTSGRVDVDAFLTTF